MAPARTAALPWFVRAERASRRSSFPGVRRRSGAEAVQAFLDQLGNAEASKAQRRIEYLVNTRKPKLVDKALGDLQQWQTTLRSLANHLEDLEYRAGALARQDLDLPEDGDPAP